jgi:predicted secreted protein
MSDKFFDFMGYILGVFGFLSILFAIWFFLSLFLGIPCAVKAKAQSMEYKYGVVMGCMVKYKGEWVDYDRLRYVE